MKRVKIETFGYGIHLHCPCCDNWEQIGIDDPRKVLHALPLVEWKDNTTDGNELSSHRCCQCNATFEIEWDYNNQA